MPMIIAALLGGLLQFAGTMVGKVLVSLGVGYVTFTAVDTSVAWAKDSFFANVNLLPPMAVQLLGTLKVGQCVNMLFSALLARLTLNGMTSGTIKKMVQK